MPYNDDLSQEKKPTRKQLLPQGWRVFKFVSGEDKPSKKGNPMFVMQIEDKETGYTEAVYLVRTEGKRWLLKAVLEAVGIQRSEDGKYNYELKDLLDKEILGEVVHEPNEFINRNGDLIKTTQHKIVDFKKGEVAPKSPNEISWNE